jgi:hypothetical protein
MPLDGYLGNVALFYFIDKLGVFHLIRRGLLGAKLIEYGHQHQRDDEPDRNILE